MALESRTKLGSYEIIDLLGKGGMGEVYRARDTKLGREVAIKVLPTEFSQDEERLARLEREARMLAALNHPNVAAIHGLEESDGTRFLVLELVEGDTLADQLKRGAIPVEESLELALQIAEALEAAHEKGVIHRDLKPANIKVTPERRVKVLDFGLAKAFIGDQTDVNLSNSPTLSMAATQQGVILGTAAYMSPEQVQGEEVDKRADIWAFGCVIYEMLTGQKVFAGDNVSLTLARILERHPDFSLLPPNLHLRVRDVLERCLEKQPQNRWHDIADVRVDIQKALADPTGGSRPQGADVAAAKVPSRLPWVAAVVLTGVVTALGFWLLAPEVEPMVTRFDDVLPDGIGLGFRGVNRPVVAISKDGSRFVYNGADGLYLRSMDEPEARRIPGTEEVATNPTFSPDGEWLAYTSPGGLMKIAAVGGAAVTLATDVGNPAGISWESDDLILYSQPGMTMSVSADGGEPEIVVGPDEEGWGSYPQLLPGGNAVLSNVGGGASATGGEIGVYSLDSGESKVLFPGSRPRYVSTGHIVYAQDDVLFAVPFDLNRLEVTGSAVRLVEGVRPAPSQYSVSDSGTLVYIAGSSSSNPAESVLALIDRGGEVTVLDPPPASYRHPRLSPDERQFVVEIAEADRGSIWVYDLSAGGALRRLTQPGEGSNTRPIWDLDGESITFASDRDGTWRVYSQLANGSQVAEPLTEAEENAIYLPESWSPDGVLSLARLGGNFEAQWELWTLSPSDEGAPQLFHDLPDSDEFGSVFSADGQWLAFASTQLAAQGQGSGIYMRPFPPSGISYAITQTDGAWPVWSGDGAELFYRRRLVAQGGARGAAVLNAVAVATPTFGEERQLPIEGFRVNQDYRDYDVSPDGQRFLMILPADQAGSDERPSPPRIRVVQNWHQELLERVPVD